MQTKAVDGFEPLSPLLLSLPTDDNYLLTVTEKMNRKQEGTPPQNISESKIEKQRVLPFTGQLWWPIPLLFVVGIICIYLSRKSQKRG
ncbi:hypothetical protein [Streptococcus sp. 20-1249]|uniref:hypothetical protein n=1 Tax=Streptococcus hepaticus TaxID=3349163 RepID=UPI003748AB02